MLTKLKSCIKNQKNNLFLLAFVVLSFGTHSALGENGEIPLDNTEIQLPDGRRLIADRRGDHSHAILLRDGPNVLWQKVYEQEYDRLWSYAFFVPIEENKFSVDINGDGDPEIAIATWDGGNLSQRKALIFSVLDDRLLYWGQRPFNIEFSRSVFP